MRPSFASWGLLALLLLQGPLLQAQPLSPALQQLLSLSSQRLQLADQVAQSKAQSGKAVQDSPREEQQLQMLAGQAGSHGVGAEQVRLLFAAQIEANKLVQYRLLSRPRPCKNAANDDHQLPGIFSASRRPSEAQSGAIDNSGCYGT
ncbi:gamma subclass chorismate mutase AroQ, partial [Pseudomonas aeruginosa]